MITDVNVIKVHLEAVCRLHEIEAKSDKGKVHKVVPIDVDSFGCVEARSVSTGSWTQLLEQQNGLRKRTILGDDDEKATVAQQN